MATRTKRCTVSGIELPVTEFYENKTQSDNLHPYCKEVDNARRATKFSTPELRHAFNIAKSVQHYYKTKK